MELMNKEELIDYFIEQLGDNHVLEKYLSIEEIRERLNANIESVTYEQEKGNVAGHYNNKTKTVNIDMKRGHTDLELKLAIVHELLHALSYSEFSNEDILSRKCGLELELEKTSEKELPNNEKNIYTRNRESCIFGKGINEGITQLLTEEILGLNTHAFTGYEEEKDITRILISMFGKEYIGNKYFATVKSNDELIDPITYLFSEILEEKPYMLDTLQSVFKSFEHLAMIKYNSGETLDEDRKKAYEQIKEKVCTDIKKLVEMHLKHLKRDDDLRDKVEQMLASFEQFHDDRINYQYNDMRLNWNTKELADTIQDIVFNRMTGNIGQKVDLYLRLTAPKNYFSPDNGETYEEWKKSLEEICIKREIVTKQDFSKSGMLALILASYGSNLKDIYDNRLQDILSNFSYTKAGSHYELLYHGVDALVRGGTHTIWFNEDGTYPTAYGLFPGNNGWEFNGGIDISSEKDKERFENIRIQLQMISDQSDKKYTRAMVIGNDVILYFSGEKQWESENRIVYTLDCKGNLVPAQEEKPKRLTDDVEEEKIDRGTSKYINSMLVGPRAKMVMEGILADFTRGQIPLEELKEILVASKSLYIDMSFSEVIDSFFGFSELDMTQEEKIEALIDIAGKLGLYPKDVGQYPLRDRYTIDTQFSKEDMLSHLIQVAGTIKRKYNIEIHIKDFYYKKIGDTYVLEYHCDDPEIQKEINDAYFSAQYNEEGMIIDPKKLDLSEAECPRSLSDDMSELDRRIMEETRKAGVTTKYMDQMAEIMISIGRDAYGRE